MILGSMLNKDELLLEKHLYTGITHTNWIFTLYDSVHCSKLGVSSETICSCKSSISNQQKTDNFNDN